MLNKDKDSNLIIKELLNQGYELLDAETVTGDSILDGFIKYIFRKVGENCANRIIISCCFTSICILPIE